jgi:hypothetical protein
VGSNPSVGSIQSAGILKRPTRADCKSAGICLRGFESLSLHQSMIHFSSLLLIIPALIIIVLLAFLVFEIMMFIDAYQNPRLSKEMRIFWLAAMLLTHPVATIAYYFLEYDKDL